jgi:hypothetical protein
MGGDKELGRELGTSVCFESVDGLFLFQFF